MKQALCILILAFGLFYDNAGQAFSESYYALTMYKWYVEHYTGLSVDDIQEIKAAHDHNPGLAHDPNVNKLGCKGCEAAERLNNLNNKD